MTLSMGQTAGSPYVTLTKTGSDGAYTLTRTVAGVATPVRGTLTVTGGTGSLVDREAPQGVAVSYTDGAEVAASTTQSVGAWFIHPALQSLDRAVLVGKYPEWTRPVQQDAVVPLGSRYPVVVSGLRQGRAGAVELIVQDATAQAGLEGILNSTRLVLFSTNHYPAGAMWVSVGDESWQPINPAKATPYWRVTLPLTEVARPTVTTTGVVTGLDVAQRYATGTDLAAAYPTGSDLLADSATWTQ